MHRIALILLLAACGGVPGPKVTRDVRVSDARLIQVNPDVKTLADADQPVFLSRGWFWLFHDGQWFRSRTSNGPWTYTQKPPVPVRQIEQPFAYVHYKHGRQGREIETVASRPQNVPDAQDPSQRPTIDTQTAIDPSVGEDLVR